MSSTVVRGLPRGRWSLRSQLLVVLTALTVPLLVVAPMSGLLLRLTEAEHVRSAERVAVSAQVSDLQERVAALTAGLSHRQLYEGDTAALLALLAQTQDVERGFAALRPRIPAAEQADVDRAYGEWQSLSDSLAVLPSRFPELLTRPGALLVALDDIGPRVLRVAQVLSEAAATNARGLQAELDRGHRQQRLWLVGLVALALVGLCAAVLTARWLYRRINGPLAALQQAARRMGEDDLAHRVVEDRTPELGALGAAFNQMADRLQEGREQLSTREQHFRALVQHASDVVAVVDVASVVSYVTPSVLRVLHVAAEELCGDRLLDLVHPDDRQLVAAVLDAVAGAPGSQDTVTCRLGARTQAAPEWRQVQLVVHDLRAEPAIGGLVVAARDVTEQTRLHEQLRHSALHDELTGLANRVLFTDRLEHALTGRDANPPAVLYCDLNGFKSVNDRLGHAAGDTLLRAVAGRLAGCLRSRDTAARLGGDEFAVLLDDVTAAQARETAERLLAVVGQSLVVAGIELLPAVSVGVAVGPAGNAEELLRHADAAMYQAKHRAQHGADDERGAVAVYDAQLADALLNRLQLRSDLERALIEEQFVLHYQPTVDLRTGRLAGVEALVRWQHPTRGLVPPTEFIPMSEEAGLISRLGLWVLETACTQVHSWQARYPDRPLHLNVNLSGRQLEYDGIVDDVAGVLAVTALDPSQLTLELTESVLLDRSEEVLARLHALKALGLSLAIDDFGTGYSSLSYLQRLPIDILKIDKSFVDPLAEPRVGDPGDALAATIINLARTLGLSSVAEGIEHASQADALHGLGCDTGQGYLYSRPLPPAELEGLFGASHGPVEDSPAASTA